MKNVVYLFLLVFFAQCSASKRSQTAQNGAAGPRSYYTLQVYHVSTPDQVSLVDSFLKTAYLPALHRQGIATVGVFKPIANDTATDKKIVVFVPYTSFQQFSTTMQRSKSDITLEQLSPAYVNAPYNSPAYNRFETILLEAFEKAPVSEMPKLSSPKSSHIYELRSYEGPTEKLYQNKVQMFNVGDEVGLFKRLNFNAVFYASVLAGSHMPNLMYMTSFESMADRDAHWKTFSEDPQWKTLSAKPEYQHNVSKADITLMTAADYSDF